MSFLFRAIVDYTIQPTIDASFTAAILIIIVTMVYSAIAMPIEWPNFLLGWGLELLLFGIVHHIGGNWKELGSLF
ncbi:hypothetical protein [Thalassoporum mexicanum]|uniref:hypothetical protein n=1 Tax=Thalassoporum mexicanum TaxID=3457544 RepID=UPI0002E55E40|nr:hypothetical protein [Pseudanabaena sp. PCC 7367]